MKRLFMVFLVLAVFLVVAMAVVWQNMAYFKEQERYAGIVEMLVTVDKKLAPYLKKIRDIGNSGANTDSAENKAYKWQYSLESKCLTKAPYRPCISVGYRQKCTRVERGQKCISSATPCRDTANGEAGLRLSTLECALVPPDKELNKNT